MTAQTLEIIYIDGAKHRLATLPLSGMLGSRLQSEFIWRSSSCWRKYIGTWLIEDNQLFLVDIEAELEGDRKACLQTMFHSARDPVKAIWFTGELRIPHGEQYLRVHQDFYSIYEKDLFYQVKNGNITKKWFVENEKPKPLSSWFTDD